MEKSLENISSEKFKFYPHWIFDYNSKKYIYGSFSNRIFELDDVTYKFLINGEKIDSTYEYDEIVNTLEKEFIIKTDENLEILNRMFNEIDKSNKIICTNITLMISQACNLRCVYCYGEGGEYSNKGYMDFDTAKAAVDWLMENSPEDQSISITFFGGEPLLSFELMEEIVEYANHKALEKKRTIKYTMTTNGLLINDKVEKFLLEHNIYTQISMDGTKETQDANRYYDNHKGCYDDVLYHTESLRKKNKLGVRATISPKDLDLVKNIEHLVLLGFSKVSWANASNLMNEEDFEKLKLSNHVLMNHFYELINNGDFEKAKKYNMITKFLNRIDNPTPKLRSCGAGRHMIAVDIKGDIFPCHRFVGIEEFKLGNIKNMKISEANKLPIYQQLGIHHFPECVKCEVQGLCGGACINENYYDTGNITMPSKTQCDYIRSMCKDLIKLYIRLNTEQKNVLLNKKISC